MIYSRFGEKVKILSGSNYEIAQIEFADGTSMAIETASLKADNGLQEIVEAIKIVNPNEI